MIDRLQEKLTVGRSQFKFMHMNKRTMLNHFYLRRFAVNAVRPYVIPKLNPNPKTGFDLSQNRNTGFTKRTRF